jgi:hypothetical protein
VDELQYDTAVVEVLRNGSYALSLQGCSSTRS